VLLGRNNELLAETADTIRARTGQTVEVLTCDLSDAVGCGKAGKKLAQDHPDLDGLIHNGAMWLPGSMAEISDADIQNCISSAAIGALILTRHVLPVLRARPDADIHTVVSTSGLANLPLLGTSVAFRAAKAAQDGFVQGLADELKQTPVRVTSVYPGDFDDMSPLDPAWTEPRRPDGPLTNREVVEAILFTLNLPASAAVRSLVIEQSGGDVFGTSD
jgi:NAD(P)-dependent dehydrogenase (short-subunit alcohol dehydrogenase family)